MATQLISREFYEAILNFDKSEAAQDLYYKVMDTETGRMTKKGRKETVRDQILRVYAILFCEDFDTSTGEVAGLEQVESTADRLYVGDIGFDPAHWYRMQHHFPVIDEDNYERFAALVIADMNAGALREEALNNGKTIVVGEANPLSMTKEQREHQKIRPVGLGI